MTMGEDTPLTTLVLPVLLRPILSQVRILRQHEHQFRCICAHTSKHCVLLLLMWRSNVDPISHSHNTSIACYHTPPSHQLERRDPAASQTLRAALTKAEQAHPGLSYDIVVGILKKGDLKVNMNESILRLQGGASETDRESTEWKCVRFVFVTNVDACSPFHISD